MCGITGGGIGSADPAAIIVGNTIFSASAIAKARSTTVGRGWFPL